MEYFTIQKNNQSKYKPVCKSVLIGNLNSGKTTLCKKLMGIEKETTSPTVGIDFCTINLKSFKLHIVDTAGHERYSELVNSYWKNAYYIIGVISLASTEINASVKSMIKYLDKLQKEENESFIILWFSKLDLYSENQLKKEVIIDQLKFDYEELFTHPYVINHLLDLFVVNQKDKKDIDINKKMLIDLLTTNYYLGELKTTSTISLNNYCNLKSKTDCCSLI